MQKLNSSSSANDYLRLHLAILLAGGTGLFGRLISIGELPLVLVRMILATLLLVVVLGKKPYHVPWPQALKMMAVGVLLAVHWVFYYGSIKAANVSIGAVCFALVGFMTAIVEPVLYRHKPSCRELLLGLLTVVAIALIFGFDSRYRVGILLGVVSSLVYTFFSLSSKSVQASSGQSSSVMLFFEMVGGALALLLIIPFYSMLFPDANMIPTGRDWGYLVLFASVFTVVPFLLQLQALRGISAFTVNLSYNLEPVYTILFAMLIFGEAKELGINFWIGVGLILLSVLLQTLFSLKERHAHRNYLGS